MTTTHFTFKLLQQTTSCLQKCILAFSLIISLITCSKSNEQTNSNPPPNTEEIKSTSISYEYHDHNCTTGKHEFTGADRGDLINQYCLSLKDDNENNFCASEQRNTEFSKKCSSNGLGLDKTSPAGEEKNKSTDTRLVGGAGIKFQRGQIEFMENSPLPASAHALYLEALNTTTYETLIPDEIRESSDIFIADVMDCGFGYSGPLCEEGQQAHVLVSYVVKVNDQPYLYVVYQYGLEKMLIASFFELSKEEPSLSTVGNKAYFYLVKDAGFAHDVEAILDLSMAAPLAEVKFIKMTPSDYLSLPLGSEATNLTLRKQLHSIEHLFRLLDQLPLDQQKLALEYTKKQMLTLKNEINDANAKVSEALLWLWLAHDIFPAEELNDIILDLEISEPSIAIALELYNLKFAENSSELNVIQIVKALNANTDPYAQWITLNLLKDQLKIYDHKLENPLITLLNSEIEEISKISFEVLAKNTISDSSLPALARIFYHKDDTYSPLWQRALNLLIISGSSECKKLLIKQLEHPSRHLRDLIYQSLSYFSLTDSEDSASFGKLLKSQYFDVIIFALEQLDLINGDIANFILLENIISPITMVHDKVAALLKAKNLSDFHLTLINDYLARPNFRDRYLILDILLSMKTSSAIASIFPKICLEPNSDYQAKMISAINNFPINEKDHFTPAFLIWSCKNDAVAELSALSMIKIGTERSYIQLFEKLWIDDRMWLHRLILSHMQNINIEVTPAYMLQFGNIIRQGDRKELLDLVLRLLLATDFPEAYKTMAQSLGECKQKPFRETVYAHLLKHVDKLSDEHLAVLFKYVSGKSSPFDKTGKSAYIVRDSSRAELIIELLISSRSPVFLKALLYELRSDYSEITSIIQSRFTRLIGEYREREQLLPKEIISTLINVLIECDSLPTKRSEKWQEKAHTRILYLLDQIKNDPRLDPMINEVLASATISPLERKSLETFLQHETVYEKEAP